MLLIAASILAAQRIYTFRLRAVLNCYERGPCLQNGYLANSNFSPNNTIEGLSFRTPWCTQQSATGKYIVRQARGWLMDAYTGIWSGAEPNYKPRPYVGAQVRLVDLTSGALVASTQTDNEGYYEFASVGPGLYLVRFSENSNSPNFNMAVEVDETAAREHPPALTAQKHDCGPGLDIY